MPEVAVAPQAAPAAPPPAVAKRFELPPEPAPQAPSAPAPEAAKPPAEVEATPDQKTEEQAPSTAPDEEKPETPEQAAKRQSRRFERRLDKAYRRAAEAEARAKAYEQELQKARQASAPPSQQDPGAPKIADFEKIEDYEAAVRKHERELATKDHQSKSQTEAARQAHAKIVEGWEARVAKAEAKYEDFDEVVGEIKPTTPWAIAIMEADNGPDIAHYLGKNLEEAEKIDAMSPRDQIRAIGRLEAKLAAEPPKPKTPSRAPAPIAPLTGASPVASDAPNEKDGIADWIRKRQKQVHARR